MLITEAFEAYEMDELLSEGRSSSTIDNYRKAKTSLLKSMGTDLPLEMVTYLHVISWKKAMYEKGIAGSTMAQHLMKLRSLLTYLKKHGFAALDPSEIKIPSFKYKETAWLTMEEMSQFLGVIDNPRDKAIFSCQFSSGARISELLSLNRDSITNGSAKIIGKGGTPGTLEFDPNALQVLDEYLATRTDKLEPLFISRNKRRIGSVQVINLAHKYAKLADIKKNVTTHVMRHSFGTNLELNGLDIYGISKQLRHKRIETTKIYIHGADLHKQADYNKYHTPTPI
jgi:site-specific recombinase XerD